MSSLTKEDFYQILKEPKNALTKQYEALIGSEEVSLEYTDEALHEIADIAFHVNEEVEKHRSKKVSYSDE